MLLIAFAAVIVWTFEDHDSAMWAGAAVVAVYAITTFTVTAGVLIGGDQRGFFAGHMAATICWIVMAAALFIYAARIPRTNRSLPIGGGLALVGAAMAKLFLFDLGHIGRHLPRRGLHRRRPDPAGHGRRLRTPAREAGPATRQQIMSVVTS